MYSTGDAVGRLTRRLSGGRERDYWQGKLVTDDARQRVCAKRLAILLPGRQPMPECKGLNDNVVLCDRRRLHHRGGIGPFSVKRGRFHSGSARDASCLCVRRGGAGETVDCIRTGQKHGGILYQKAYGFWLPLTKRRSTGPTAWNSLGLGCRWSEGVLASTAVRPGTEGSRSATWAKNAHFVLLWRGSRRILCSP
jgi:hypothetical protein